MFGKKKNVQPSQDVGKKKKPIYKRVWFWLLVLVVIGAAMGGNEETADDPQQEGTTRVEEQVEESPPVEEPEETEAPDESVKEDARLKDLEIFSAVMSAETKYKGMISALGSENPLETYNACKDTKDFAQTCWGLVADQKDDLNADYAQACQYYFVEIKSICDDIMDYIDSQKMEDLSNAQEGIENLNSHILNIVATRMTYLGDAGFTDEEIAQILEQ